MPRTLMDVLYASSAHVILRACRTLAQELELTLVDARWTYDLSPDHGEAPYHLVLTITAPFKATPEFWCTRDQVLGYAPGTTRDAVDQLVRQDLMARLAEIR